MRDYLLQFFKDFEYEQTDAEILLSCYDKIMEEEQSAKEWQELLAQYEGSYLCDYEALLQRADQIAARLSLQEYTLHLLLFLCLSKALWGYYEQAGIDKAICHDTLLDLKYKLEECKLVKGTVGSFVAHWFRHAFSLELFALGRLQFEKGTLAADFKGFKKGHPALNVHIPRSLEPLDHERCRASYARAAEFFKDYTGKPCIFTCHSWLLNPENPSILHPKSNILSFMAEYEILFSTIDIKLSNLWRIFDTEEKNPSRLPADSSLRKSIIAHLKKGGKLYSGYGAFLY